MKKVFLLGFVLVVLTSFSTQPTESPECIYCYYYRLSNTKCTISNVYTADYYGDKDDGEFTSKSGVKYIRVVNYTRKDAIEDRKDFIAERVEEGYAVSYVTQKDLCN